MERDEETMERYVGILPRSKLTSPSSEQVNCCGQPELGGRTVEIGSAMMDVEGIDDSAWAGVAKTWALVGVVCLRARLQNRCEV